MYVMILGVTNEVIISGYLDYRGILWSIRVNSVIVVALLFYNVAQ